MQMYGNEAPISLSGLANQNHVFYFLKSRFDSDHWKVGRARRHVLNFYIIKA